MIDSYHIQSPNNSFNPIKKDHITIINNYLDKNCSNITSHPKYYNFIMTIKKNKTATPINSTLTNITINPTNYQQHPIEYCPPHSSKTTTTSIYSTGQTQDI